MRDYSFGNFISTLRERGGMSQYQLGTLVGVSDKAVSKWENGVSKPRTDVIKKLAKVLCVSVDELLTCEYDSSDYVRKDLFAMKNKIIKQAEKRLEELYGDKPPMIITNRFKTEQVMLEGQEALLWMGFMGKLYEKCREAGAYFEVRNAQMGASLIAWLLGGTNVNPLPAHYYCPVCHKIQFIPNVKCGIDAPNKKCICGMEYYKDGFGIDVGNMYPIERSNDIYVSNNTTKIVEECLNDYFLKYGRIRKFNIIYTPITDVEIPDGDDIIGTKFALISQEMSKEFPEYIITMQYEDFRKLRDEISILTVNENKQEYISFFDMEKIGYTDKQIRSYINYSVRECAFRHYYSGADLNKLFKNPDNMNFSGLLAVYGFLHGTNAWENNSEFLYDKGIPLNDLISCREDVYSYLYHKIETKYNNPLGLVFEIKEDVRKGKYFYNDMPAEIEKLLSECEVPDWYIESMKKIRYLFPKTNLTVQLKRNICKTLMKNGYQGQSKRYH